MPPKKGEPGYKKYRAYKNARQKAKYHLDPDFKKRRKASDQKSTQKCFARAMVHDAKNADVAAGRLWDEDEYMTKEFIHACIKQHQGYCLYCHRKMNFGVGANRSKPDGLTSQRINNNVAHIIPNVVFVCHECNQLATNVVPHETMLQHGESLRERSTSYCSYIDHIGDRVLMAECFSGVAEKRCRCKPCDSIYKNKK